MGQELTKKRVKGKLIFKHETEADWRQSNYIPEQGEKILYDPDENHNYTRVKYGDGSHIVKDLPFSPSDKIPQFSTATKDKVLTVNEQGEAEWRTIVNDTESGLPEVTEADNGKMLMVVGGKWENVKFPAGTQYESVTVTIPASSWNDNGSQIHAVWYGLGTSVDGCDIDVSLAASSTKEQFEEAARCGVYCSSAMGTELVFTALYTMPTIDLTFDIRITKPTTLSYSVDEASMTLTILEGYDG